MNYIQEVKRRMEIVLPDLPDELNDLYSLLAVTKGIETTLEDVHDAWAIWRNQTNPEHKSLIPFISLTEEVQELDRKYMLGIHQVASVDKTIRSI